MGCIEAASNTLFTELKKASTVTVALASGSVELN